MSIDKQIEQARADEKRFTDAAESASTLESKIFLMDRAAEATEMLNLFTEYSETYPGLW